MLEPILFQWFLCDKLSEKINTMGEEKETTSGFRERTGETVNTPKLLEGKKNGFSFKVGKGGMFKELNGHPAGIASLDMSHVERLKRGEYRIDNPEDREFVQVVFRDQAGTRRVSQIPTSRATLIMKMGTGLYHGFLND